MSEIKQRDYLWDNVKALLIFLVVAGHALELSAMNISIATTADDFIYSFHMPAFIFVSGFWAKRYCRDGHVRGEKVGVLIAYYTVFQILFTLLKLIVGVSLKNASFFSPARGLWYLLAIIFYYLLVPVIEKLPAYIVIPACIVLSLLIGNDTRANNYLAIMRTFTFMPYFFIGYYLSEKGVARLRTLKARLRLPLGAALVLCSVSIWMIQPTALSRKLFFGKFAYSRLGRDFLEGAVLRMESIVVALIMIAAILLIIPQKKTFFSKIGTNSLQIFIFHMPLMIALGDSGIIKPDINSYLMFVLMMLISLAVTVVLSLDIFTYPFKGINFLVKKLYSIKS